MAIRFGQLLGEPPQAVFHGLVHPSPRRTAPGRVVGHRVSELGGQHHAVAPPAHGPAHELLGLSEGIDVGHVDRRDPGVERSVEDAGAIGLGRGAPGAEHHRPEAERRDVEARGPERSELHLNVGHESGHYFDNLGYPVEQRHTEILRAIDEHRRALGTSLHPVRFLEDRYQALVSKYYETGKSPLPCTALSSSCFVDAYWNLYPCSIWSEKVGNLRDNGFDLRALWAGPRRVELREAVVEERCSHCWTPCEAYPTILGNLAQAAVVPITRDKPRIVPAPVS